MRKLFNILIFMALLFTGAELFGQRQLSGVVRDTEGQTLPGANIVVTGTLTGATTDLDGRFTIELPAGREEIEVSYVGYTTRKVNVQGRNQIEIVLSIAAQQLQEMVVTALGIKRESKALGYSVQQVDANNLQTTNRISPLTGLAGQVAGLQISESGSGAGGSQKILIRGANSLTGSNDPLFVIDGVPVDNSGGSSGGLFGGFDYGSAINNINFDDIESISVLKGGAASALYGARGQNGVIIITTKSGSRKEGLGISYQTMFSTQQPLIKPDLQNLFAQGSGGNFGQLNPRSWGPKMTGQNVTNFLGETQALNPAENHPYDDFFRYDFNMDHSLSIDKRGETNAIFFSTSWNRNNGLIPTNRFDKKSFNLRYESKLSDFLSFDARANYIRAMFTEPGSPVWEEEAVEVFLQAPGFSNKYFEIDLNPLNTITQLRISNNGAPGDKRVYEGDTQWRCAGLITRTFIDGHLNSTRQCSGWTAELAIPLISLIGGRDYSGLWRANFFRVDASSENLAYSAWLPTGEIDFHRMEYFGQLCIG